MSLGRRLVAVSRQQLAQEDNFGRLNGVALKDQEMHLTRKKHKTAFAFMDGANQSPTLGSFHVDRGLEQSRVNRPTEQPSSEHLDAILFHDLTMTYQHYKRKP